MSELSGYEYLFKLADDPKGLWDARAEILGFSSVMSLGKPEHAHLEETELVRRGLHNVLGDLTSKSVLEIGTGVGRFTKDIEQRSASLVSVDLSRKMLNRAMQTGLGSTTLLQAIGQHLPFKDNSFDVVFETTVSIHITDDSDFDQFVGEAMRVLKPDGTILFCNPIAESGSTQKHPYLKHRSMEVYEKASGTRLQESHVVQLLNNSVHFLAGVKPEINK